MPNAPSRAGHLVLEHTAEAELLVFAPSFEQLLAEAARGLAGMIRPSAPAAADWRSVRVQSVDEAALLIDWLNELLFIAETDNWVPLHFDEPVVERAPHAVSMQARVEGYRAGSVTTAVKAATLHGVAIERDQGLVRARVIFDV